MPSRPFRRTPAGLVGPVRLRTLIDEHGGFTVDLRGGARVCSGISVAIRPGSSLSFAHGDWSDHVVDGWLRDVAAGSSGPVHIGGWLDPRSGAVWLDVVRILPATLRWIACAIGRLNGQHCVFDLARRETVLL